MSKRKKVYVFLAVLGAIVILLLTAKAIADNTWRTYTPPAVEVPDVQLTYPATEIKAASDVKLPEEPEPAIVVEPVAPILPPSSIQSSPNNIPFGPSVSTPQYRYPVVPYQPPVTVPQVPLPAPQQPLLGPITDPLVNSLPPAVTGPVEGLLEPLNPIVQPITGTVKDLLPDLPPPALK